MAKTRQKPSPVITDDAIDMQKLVNAQVEVNRAVFLMNVRGNRSFYPTITDDDISDDKVKKHIALALDELGKAVR
jgi:hypothetical protein